MSFYHTPHMYNYQMMYPHVPYTGRTGGFSLIVVLFILLIIVGAAYTK